MAGEESRHHDIDKNCSNRENREGVWIETDEGIDDEEGDGMGGFAPVEQTLDLVLKGEYYADSGQCQLYSLPPITS